MSLCYHIGFGTARDPWKAFDLARRAKAMGHPVAETFSHLLATPGDLVLRGDQGWYATQVLRLLRSDPNSSAGLPPLVNAFFSGDKSMAQRLLNETACRCSSTMDGCGALHWLFAFQDQEVLNDVVDMLRKTKDGHMATLADLPFSTPREVHCQWPLKLLGNPLAVAISVNSLMAVRALLELGANPFSPVYDETQFQPQDPRSQWTAFHIAARYRCSDILQYLIEHSDPWRQRGLSALGCALAFSTPLERLAMHGSRRTEQLDATVQIIRSMQPLAAVAPNGMTALMQAIDFQDHDVTAALLRANPELAATPFGSPKDKHIFNLPIHFATQIASHREVPESLEIPALINTYTGQLSAANAPPRDHAGRTPLHLAVTGESSVVTEWVLQKRPGLLHVEDDLGRTPLHYCISTASCKLLLEKGANVDHTDKLGMAALHRMCLTGASELVSSLLEKARPKLDLRNNEYELPCTAA